MDRRLLSRFHTGAHGDMHLEYLKIPSNKGPQPEKALPDLAFGRSSDLSLRNYPQPSRLFQTDNGTSRDFKKGHF